MRHLGATAPPNAYLDILDSAFDAVKDRDDVFVISLNTMQNAGEKSSVYLQHLQAALLSQDIASAVARMDISLATVIQIHI